MAGISDKELYKGKPNPFDEAAKGAKILLTEMEKLIVKGKEVSNALKLDIQSNKKQNSADLKTLTDQTSRLTTATKAGNEIIKEKQRLEVTLKKLNSDKIQQNEQLKVQVQLQRKNNKELARDQLKLINSFEKLTKKTNESQKRFKDLATQFGVNSKQAKAAKAEFEKLDNRLSKVNKAARDGRRDVGQYAKGWQGVKKLLVGGLGILGVTAGFSAIRSGITKLVSTFSKFQKQVSKVGAISGASATDLKALTVQAQALGEATEKTASEVAQLQLELAKLGFDPKQIQNATDSILDLSTAVDADLGESAKVVGSTLRAFGLEAEETGRVTDVMALAFSRSSLDITKFSSAMATVAPVAKKFGFSVEETTSLLAQLTDAGLDASSAGTATRKILLNLADSSGKLAKSLGGPVDNLEDLLQGLTKLKNEGTDLGEALELTDVRSVTAFATFLDGVDKTRKLATELENAKGSAERMARIMRDNLSGDTDKAKSAMQGLFINIGKRLNPALRNATQNFTGLVGKLNELVKIKASEEIEKERKQTILLVAQLQDANTSYEDRVILLEELNGIAPDVAKGINAEKIAYKQLNTQLDLYLERAIERIALAELEAERTEELTKIASIRIKQAEVLAETQNTLIKVAEEFRVTEGSLQEQIKGTIALLYEEVKAQETSGDAGKKTVDSRGNIVDLRTEEQKQLQSLINIQSFLNTKDNEANELSETTIANISEKIRILREQLGITKDLTDETEDNVTVQEELNDAIREFTEAIEKAQSIATEGITIKYGEEFDLDKRTDKQKYIDTLVAENAKKSKDANDALIAQAIERQNIIEDLETQHYESLLSIAFNFANRKAAQDKSLSNEELQKVLENNANTEAAYHQLAETLISIGQQILDSKIRQLDNEISAINQKINEQEQKVNQEIELQKSGAASNVAIETERLRKLQEQRDKDLEERKKIQKQQETINLLTQVSALATAVANIILAESKEGVIGVVLGLAAAAAAIIGFSTYKSEAESAVSAEEGGTFTRKGAYIEKGNRHSGGGNKYNALETERGEMHSILSRTATKKYGSFMEDITDAANSGKLNPDQLEMYNYSMSQLTPNNIVINNNYHDLLSEMQNVSRLLSSQKIPIYDKNGKFRLYDNYGMMKKMEQ